MNELVYLLKVAESEALFEQLGHHLLLDEIPHYVRVASIAPLSNYGYGPESEGTLLAWLEQGIIYGDAENPEVPSTFVPWQNIAYISGGDALKSRLTEEAALLDEVTAEE